MTIKVADIEQRIYEKRGNVAAVARSFGVARSTIYRRAEKSPRLQLALEEARETMIDNAEVELYDQALNGNIAALIFFLKTQGKRRGYTERHEVTGADGDSLVVRLDWGDNADD